MTVMSDFRPELEIWQYRACTTKNMQYNPNLMAKSPKVLQEQFGHCGLGYGADTTLHRTYF